MLATIVNRAGLTLTLAYDTLGRLSSVTDPAGRALTFAYDSRGRIATVTDPDSKVITYAYATLSDQTSNLTSVTYPDAKVRTYLYNEAAFSSGNVPHALTGIVDENGDRYGSYTYNSSELAVGSKNGINADTLTLSISSGSTTVTDALGVARVYTFKNVEGLPRFASLNQPCKNCMHASAQSQTFDANGNITERRDFNGNLSCYTYDTARNLETKRVEGLSGTMCPGTAVSNITRTVTTEWDSTLRLPYRIAEPKRITTFTYDSQGNLASKSIQGTTDTSGALAFSATATGSPRTWTYTNTYSGSITGLVTQRIVNGPRTDVADTTTYVYDSTTGDLTSVTNALSQTTSLGNYDAHGRPQQITDPNGLVTTLAYDLRGRLTSRTAGGETTAYEYDGVGQLKKVTMPDGSYVSYTYDTAHRLTQVQDNLGNKIVYTLDAVGNRTKDEVFDPGNTLRQTLTRAYDAWSQLRYEAHP